PHPPTSSPASKRRRASAPPTTATTAAPAASPSSHSTSQPAPPNANPAPRHPAGGLTRQRVLTKEPLPVARPHPHRREPVVDHPCLVLPKRRNQIPTRRSLAERPGQRCASRSA